MSKKVVAYLRVSTDAQTEKYGLDLQKSAIVQKANTDNVCIAEWYVDGGYSGSTLERPDMQRLITDVKADKISKIYVFKLDRLSRDTIDTLTLLNRVFPQHNAKVVSVNENIGTETPDDRFMLGIHAEFAEHERAVFFQRTRAGRAERAKKGLWVGGATVPYGYYYDRNDGTLHPVPEQAEKVRKVFDMYISGESCAKICAKLGLSTERLVRNIVARRAYTGKVKHLAEYYDGLHEPLISEETFEKAQQEIARRTRRGFVSDGNLLTGICYCGKCGSRMRYQSWVAGNHKLVCYAKYQSSKPCLKRAPHCDEVVWASLVEQEVERAFKEFAVAAIDSYKKESDESFLLAEIKRAKKKLQNLYSLYGDAPNDSLLEVIERETRRIKMLQGELEVERTRARKPNKRRELSYVSDVWDELTVQEKNHALKMCVDKVVITDDDVNIYFEL